MYGLVVDIERCPDGIELIELPPIQTATDAARGTLAQGLTVPTPNELLAPLIFRYRTARRESARLEFTNLENLVVIAFVNANDDERRRQFFEQFGLTIPGSQVSRDDTIENQIKLRLLLQAASDDNAAAAIETANEMIASHKGSELQPSWHLAGQRGVPHVVLKSRSLLTFMLMETSSAIAYGAQLSTCQHCGTVFLTGKNTYRRSRAKFCSDRCRVAAMRARQAAGN